MATKKINPTSPGQRGMTRPDYSEITTSTPEKSLVVQCKKTGGRKGGHRAGAVFREAVSRDVRRSAELRGRGFGGQGSRGGSGAGYLSYRERQDAGVLRERESAGLAHAHAEKCDPQHPQRNRGAESAVCVCHVC